MKTKRFILPFSFITLIGVFGVSISSKGISEPVKAASDEPVFKEVTITAENFQWGHKLSENLEYVNGFGDYGTKYVSWQTKQGYQDDVIKLEAQGDSSIGSGIVLNKSIGMVRKIDIAFNASNQSTFVNIYANNIPYVTTQQILNTSVAMYKGTKVGKVTQVEDTNIYSYTFTQTQNFKYFGIIPETTNSDYREKFCYIDSITITYELGEDYFSYNDETDTVDTDFAGYWAYGMPFPEYPTNLFYACEIQFGGLSILDPDGLKITTSNEYVATVDEYGEIIITGGGRCAITVQYADFPPVEIIVFTYEEYEIPVAIHETTSSTSEGWQRINDVSELNDGDLIVIANENSKTTLGQYYEEYVGEELVYDGNFVSDEESVFNSGSLSIGSDTTKFIVVKGDDGYGNTIYQFLYEDGTVGFYKDKKGLAGLCPAREAADWTVEFSGNNAIISMITPASGEQFIVYDSDSGKNYTFCARDSAATSDEDAVQIYKYFGELENKDILYDDTEKYHSPALSFAHNILDKFDAEVCNLPSGPEKAAEIKRIWDEVFSTDNKYFNELNATSYKLLQHAEASRTDEGDTIQRAMGKYELLLERYGKLGLIDIFERGVVMKSNLIRIASHDADTVVIIGCALLALTFCGVYIGITKARKKAED